jgi:methyl-accepting chemotaxis protein
MVQPRRRKKILINALQYRLIALLVVCFSLVIAAFVGAVFLPIMYDMQADRLSFVQKQNVADQFLMLHKRLWPALLLVLGLVIVHSVIISHRIAGPIYRIRDVILNVASGNLMAEARFRKKDYTSEQADALNQMIVSLRRVIVTVRDEQREANNTLMRLRSAMRGVANDDMEDLSHELAQRLKAIDQALQQFKVGSVKPPRQGDDRQKVETGKAWEPVGAK